MFVVSVTAKQMNTVNLARSARKGFTSPKLVSAANNRDVRPYLITADQPINLIGLHGTFDYDPQNDTVDLRPSMYFILLCT